MKIIKSLFLLLFIGSSYGQAENEKSNLTIIEPKSNNTEIPKKWKNLHSIQDEWISVEKDRNGYLIYEPCDGVTPTIKFEPKNIIINCRLESEKYRYENFTRIIGDKLIRLDAYNLENETRFRIKIKIIDSKKGLVLWEFNNIKWLMTPIKNKERFRRIKNNCIDSKKSELKFLPIEDTVEWHFKRS